MIRSIRTLGLAVCAAGALVSAPTAFAQRPAPNAPTTLPCDGVLQERSSCLRERGAAKEEARRDGLTSAPPVAYDRNALERCKLQPMGDRAACEARVTGSGMSSTEGSVLGGGMIRETVTPIPAPAR